MYTRLQCLAFKVGLLPSVVGTAPLLGSDTKMEMASLRSYPFEDTCYTQ